MILRRRKAVDAATAEWILDRFHWLTATLGPKNFYEHTRLILPTRRFFEDRRADDPHAPSAIFDEVRGHMGVTHWPCKLVPRAVLGEKANAPFAPNSVAGTFYHSDGDAVITYDPRLPYQRLAFIGTLAHELAHYLLHEHVHSAPGGEAEHEMLTDLTVVHAGFGVIDMAGARQVGWQGYLDLEARSFALAVFLRLKEIPLTAANAHFDERLTRLLANADRQLDAHTDELSHLRAQRPRQ